MEGAVLSGRLTWVRKHLEKDRVKDGTLGRNPGLLGSETTPPSAIQPFQ